MQNRWLASQSAFVAANWTPMANILGLGLPIGGLLGIKLGVFLGAGILMGFWGSPRSGPPAGPQLRGHQLTVPLGL